MADAVEGTRLYYRERSGFQWWWLIWVAAGVCLFLCGVGIALVSSGGGGLLPGGGLFGGDAALPDQLSILMVGADNSKGKGLADTIIFAMVYPKTGEISAVSIPRDSRVEVPGVGFTRINASHSMGGMPLTMQTVEMLLGLPVDRYIEVDVPGLVKLVDAIGGVDLEVPKRMHYTDRSQKLYIDLQPGFQHLDGTQAMGFVRFRHDAIGDFGRMERQREFLHAVMKKLFSPEHVTDLPRMADAFVHTVNTNLTTQELLSLKRIIEQSGPDSIRTETLPATDVRIGRADMLELDPDQVKETVDRVLLHRGMSVEVLNGTTIEGLASRVATALQEKGCEVTSTGNAVEQSRTTLVIDHRGSARRAERVAGWLGRGAISVDSDGQNPADVTVILGKDFLDSGP